MTRIPGTDPDRVSLLSHDDDLGRDPLADHRPSCLVDNSRKQGGLLGGNVGRATDLRSLLLAVHPDADA